MCADCVTIHFPTLVSTSSITWTSSTVDLRGTVFPSSNQSNPSKHVTWDYPKTALPWQKNIECTSSYYTSFWNLANDCHTSCLGLVKSATLWMCTGFWRLPAWTRPAACSSTCHQEGCNTVAISPLMLVSHIWGFKPFSLQSLKILQCLWIILM